MCKFNWIILKRKAWIFNLYLKGNQPEIIFKQAGDYLLTNAENYDKIPAKNGAKNANLAFLFFYRNWMII